MSSGESLEIMASSGTPSSETDIVRFSLGAVIHLLISKTQISISLQPAFIIIQQAHGFGRFHAVGFDGFVHLRLHLALEFVLVVLHVGERLHDGRAFDDFLDVIAGRLVGLEKDVDFVHTAKQVV